MDEREDFPLVVPKAPPISRDDRAIAAAPGFGRFLRAVVAIWAIVVVVIAVTVALFNYPDDFLDPGQTGVDYAIVLSILASFLMAPAVLGYGLFARIRPRGRVVGSVFQFCYLGLLAIIMVVSYEEHITDGIASTAWLVGAMAIGFAARYLIAPRATSEPDRVDDRNP